jgi:SHS2 domain-containing protein
MKKYEILEHPAELRIRVFGKTKEELFKNAALAMANILSRGSTSQILKKISEEVKPRKVEIKSTDINTLLVDFLNDILAKGQINKCIYSVSDIRLNASCSILHASCVGHPVDHFDEDIKAVTYQDVDIKLITQNSLLKTKFWQTDLVFDI